jgi:flagellar biosynthetic protein FliQ
MSPELAIDIFKGVIIFSLYIVAPFLGVMLVIGFITSLFQSVTSIQEQTLTFAPKLLALAGL